jgi:hypothetical protein
MGRKLYVDRRHAIEGEGIEVAEGSQVVRGGGLVSAWRWHSLCPDKDSVHGPAWPCGEPQIYHSLLSTSTLIIPTFYTSKWLFSKKFHLVSYPNFPIINILMWCYMIRHMCAIWFLMTVFLSISGVFVIKILLYPHLEELGWLIEQADPLEGSTDWTPSSWNSLKFIINKWITRFSGSKSKCCSAWARAVPTN